MHPIPSGKCVVLVTYNKDVFTNPTLDIFLKRLLDRQVHVVLVAPSQQFYPDYFDRITRLDPPLFIYGLEEFSWWGRRGVKRSYQRLAARLFALRPNAVIGIDPEGFVTAARLNSDIKSRLGYFSFEIFFADEVKAYAAQTGDHKFRMVKEAEIRYFPECSFLLIQDEQRKGLLCAENGCVPETCFLVPVSGVRSYTGEVSRQERADGRKRIVYSGSLEEWSGLPWLLDDFERSWDDRFHLVLHTRFSLNMGHPVLDKATALSREGRPVSIHNEPFRNLSDLERYISTFDFGMVTYAPMGTPYTGKNIREIGLASGKFSMFMMLGVPVVASSCASYLSLHQQYDFGVLVENVREIGRHAGQLLDHYPLRTRACKQLYAERLDPSAGIDNLVTYLMNA
jgi:glycosyltransferase involved in cell wall biosynthesis